MEQRQNRNGAAILGLIIAAAIAAVLFFGPPPPGPPSSGSEPIRSVQKDRFDIIGNGGCRASGRFTNTGSVPIELGEVHLRITSRGQLVDDDLSLFDIYPLAIGQSTNWETLFRCPRRSGRIQYELTIIDQGRPVAITEPPAAR